MLINTNATFVMNRNSLLYNSNEKLKSTQKALDSQCIRLMIPYTPMLNGVLFKSATLGTVIGSGEIKYNAPYARYQYYGKLMLAKNGSSYAKRYEQKYLTDINLQYNKSRHAKAGRLWFEKMKNDKMDTLKRIVITHLD